MVYSMTGFGSAQSDADETRISVEIRTLNSRYLDLQLKLPREMLIYESQIRNICTERLARGKVVLVMETGRQIDTTSTSQINIDLFKSYYQQLIDLSEEIGRSASDVFSLALNAPGVFDQSETQEQAMTWEHVASVVDEAIDNCLDFRSQEGAAISKKLDEYIISIDSNLNKIEEQDPYRVEIIKARLKNNLSEFIKDDRIDPNRFEQELIYYIEKLDINEEKVRLRNHLEYFNEVKSSTNTPGKKLSFVSQEIGREINTIGSKANDATIQRYVVEMKEELEKIKEQLLNLV